MTTSRKRARNQQQCTLSFKTLLKSKGSQGTAKLIDFLNSEVPDKNRVTVETLEARFLPLLLDKDDPQSRIHAMDCLGRLEGFKQAIIRHYGFPQGAYPMPIQSVDIPADTYGPSSEDEFSDVTVSSDLAQRREQAANMFG